MIDKFDVQGFFYNQKGLKFRRFLDIKRKGMNSRESDLNVIMMNPGSSKPKGIDENLSLDYLDRFVEAHPDNTQSQIMKIMEKCKFNYAKIVNLSDIRNTNSNNFYKMLSDELKETEHSIFHESNRHLLKSYLNPNAIFILAWGVDNKLQCLSELALNVLTELWGTEIIKVGLKHSTNKHGYYHPLPKTQQSQKDWIERMSKKIESLHG
jgi:Protein of unknown function (DUF1643).